jgi:hypothetical protein
MPSRRTDSWFFGFAGFLQGNGSGKSICFGGKHVIKKVDNNAVIREEAIDLLQEPDFFGELLRAVKRSGLVGEARNAILIYIAAISALLSHPINVIVKGQSSAGKNFLVSRVLRLFPAEAIREITSSSAQAWVYSDTAFQHKVVYLQERNDSAGALHPVRLLISEGRLVRIVTAREGKNLVTKRFVAEGPIASISTTTKNRLEIDDETRHVSVWVDESAEQTRRVMQAYLSPEGPLIDREIAVWHEAHRLIAERATWPIELPAWFERVADIAYAGNVASRRYFPAFVESVRVVALIRSFQENREPGKKAATICVDFSDYALAVSILDQVFVDSLRRGFDANLETRLALVNLAKEKEGAGVGATDLAARLNISDTQAYRRLQKAAEAGMIARSNQPTKNNPKLFLPTPPPRFVPRPKELVDEISSIETSVDFIDPFTGKQVTLGSAVKKKKRT